MKKAKPHDSLVVLGAQVKMEGIPSETLRRRLVLALEIFQKQPVPVICCGAQGHNEPMCEGAFMCRWLEEKGVPREFLIEENHSYDTIDNIRNAKALLTSRGLCMPLIVTSDYHLFRSLVICRREGLSTAGGAGSPSKGRYWLKNHLREVLAWGKFFLKW